MADDWQPGDLALCVGNENMPNAPVRVGAVYSVTDVEGPYKFVGSARNWFGVGLRLAGVRFERNAEWDHLVAALYFRKIKPLTDEERDEFLADIKTPEPVQ